MPNIVLHIITAYFNEYQVFLVSLQLEIHQTRRYLQIDLIIFSSTFISHLQNEFHKLLIRLLTIADFILW